MLSEVNKSQRSHCRTVEKIKIGGVFVDFVDFCYFLLLFVTNFHSAAVKSQPRIPYSERLHGAYKERAIHCHHQTHRCPVQLNNTWIFPSQLMTGNLSPASAVPTRISGTPFRNPHGLRHFTKEEFKRATQARELHCFLGHPP